MSQVPNNFNPQAAYGQARPALGTPTPAGSSPAVLPNTGSPMPGAVRPMHPTYPIASTTGSPAPMQRPPMNPTSHLAQLTSFHAGQPAYQAAAQRPPPVQPTSSPAPAAAVQPTLAAVQKLYAQLNAIVRNGGTLSPAQATQQQQLAAWLTRNAAGQMRPPAPGTPQGQGQVRPAGQPAGMNPAMLAAQRAAGANPSTPGARPPMARANPMNPSLGRPPSTPTPRPYGSPHPGASASQPRPESRPPAPKAEKPPKAKKPPKVKEDRKMKGKMDKGAVQGSQPFFAAGDTRSAVGVGKDRPAERPGVSSGPVVAGQGQATEQPTVEKRRKEEGLRGSMRVEISRLMYGAGDVVEPDADTVDYMEDMVVDFLTDLCRPVHPIRSNPTSQHQPVPLSADIIRHRLSSTSTMHKYLERFDHMVHMSDVLKAHRRIANPNVADILEQVGTEYLGLNEDGGAIRGTGASGVGGKRPAEGVEGEDGPRKKGRPPKPPGERKKPGPAKGWKLNRDPHAPPVKKAPPRDPNAPKRKYTRKADKKAAEAAA